MIKIAPSLLAADYLNIGGEIRRMADAGAEARKRMAELTQSLKDAGAARAIEESHRETPEQKAEYQHAARVRMDDLRIKLDKGATITEKDVTDAARWDAELTRNLLAQFKTQNGGSPSDSLLPYDELFNGGLEARQRRVAADKSELARASRENRRPGKAFLRQVERDREELAQIESLGPEVLRTARLGTGYDKEADRLYAELHPQKEEETKGSLSEGVPDERPGSLISSKTDSLSASGIGYTGNPMQTTENLLREIRDDARRNARNPAAGVLTA